MEYVRHGVRKVLVLHACAEHAEVEFEAKDALVARVISMRGLDCIQRWGNALDIYRLRMTAERRLFPNARSRALRAVAILCAPKWLGRWISQLWPE